MQTRISIDGAIFFPAVRADLSTGDLRPSSSRRLAAESAPIGTDPGVPGVLAVLAAAVDTMARLTGE